MSTASDAIIVDDSPDPPLVSSQPDQQYKCAGLTGLIHSDNHFVIRQDQTYPMDKIVFVCKSEFCQNRRDWKEAVQNLSDFSINRRQTLQELKNYLNSNEHGAFFFLSRPVNTPAETENDDDDDIIVMPATSSVKPDMPAARSLKRRHGEDEDIIDWSDVSSSEPGVPIPTSAEPEIDNDDIIIMPATTSFEPDARQNTPSAHNKKKSQYHHPFVSKEERDAINATAPVGAFQPKAIRQGNRRRKDDDPALAPTSYSWRAYQPAKRPREAAEEE